MSFTSFPILLIIAISVAVYYALRKNQWLVLLVVSLGFYLLNGLAAMISLIIVALSVYLFAIALELDLDKKIRKALVFIGCLLNFGMLFTFKYSNTGLLMPLGISFFMFQSIGYLIDVYRKKYDSEKNFLKFLLFVSFFPQMIQGPISRFNDLSPQLFDSHDFSFDSLRDGLQLMMLGYFKKLVIADRAAVLVGTVMANPWGYGGAIEALAILFYCIQLYCDFSGGIDITRGIARLFGINMADNFRRPLFATSLADFWRRWHITLGSWMRDYVFYPLTLSKPFIKLGKKTRKKFTGKLGKIIPTSAATFIVYLIIGIWHGSSFKYIAFGFWNGAIITASILLEPQFIKWKEKLSINNESKLWHFIQCLRTNIIVFVGRYITRAPRFKVALWMMAQAVVNPNLEELFSSKILTLGITKADFLIIFFGLAVLIFMEFYEEKRGKFNDLLNSQNETVQIVVLILAILVIFGLGVFRADYISSEFIYKQY